MRDALRSAPTLLLPALVLAGDLAAQRVLAEGRGALAERFGEICREAGDCDRDGVPDFVAGVALENDQARIEVRSGRDGSLLWSVGQIPGSSNSEALDAVGIGDVDGDGSSDVAIATWSTFRVHSGADGSLLVSDRSRGLSITPIGDFDGDGLADCAVGGWVNSDFRVDFVDGSSAVILAFVEAIPSSDRELRISSVGDLDGDGRHEVVIGGRDHLYIIDSQSGSPLRRITHPSGRMLGQRLGTADLDGDGRREILIARDGREAPGIEGRLEVYEPVNGTLLFAIETGTFDSFKIGREAVGVGDLDADGTTDIAVQMIGGTGGAVFVFSGRTQQVLWRFEGSTVWREVGAAMGNLGDLDGDGLDDLAIGCPGPYPLGGGWQLLSSRILATVDAKDGACGGGPFLPQLGMTRPLLGETATVVCRDGAANANGILVLSLAPSYPTPLGAGGCTAWFDLANWSSLHTASTPNWSLPVPIPADPRLAGVELAMQVLYGPTRGPLGFDLSNGVHARLGD